jgi:hypothetical protein
MHARNQIIEAMASILSRNPVAWKSVAVTSEPSARQIWPYLMVYPDGDQGDAVINITVSDPAMHDREMTVFARGMLKAPTDSTLMQGMVDKCSGEIDKKITQAALRAQLPNSSSMTLAPIATNWRLVLAEDDPDGIDHIEVFSSWRIGYSVLEGSPEVLI